MALSDLDLLAVWEGARPLPPAAQGAALLAWARPGAALDELLGVPVGRRDAELLALRETWFGATLVCTTSCPRCGVAVELDLPTAALKLDAPEAEAIDVGGIAVRLPDTRDLVAAAEARDAGAARALLLRRCVAADVDALPPDTVEAIVRAMGEHDPAGDAAIALACPDCGHEWESAVDVAAHLWSEVDAAAMRALRDVHLLARAYGWSEREILAIPARRREIYLGLVSA